MKTMRALVLPGPGAEFELVERPIPSPGPGEALVRVRACGSGLTIHHIKAGRRSVHWPIVLGHEIAGEVAEVGEHVTAVRPGDHVTAYYYLSCGDCRWCRTGREPMCPNSRGTIGRAVDGGYADYCVLPAWNLVPLPAGLPYEQRPADVAVIGDAIVTPLKVARRARLAPLETVVVIGAGGGVGIHMVQVAKLRQAQVIAVDLGEEKLQLARQYGADATIDASTTELAAGLGELGASQAVDVVIDFAGTASTLAAGLSALGRGGRFVMLAGREAIPFHADVGHIITNEIELLGSRYASKQDLVEALDLVAGGWVQPVVSRTAPLEEADDIHRALEEGALLGRGAVIL